MVQCKKKSDWQIPLSNSSRFMQTVRVVCTLQTQGGFMGGKRQKFPYMLWLVKLQSFKSNETYFKFNSCLKRQPMQLNKWGGGWNPRGQVEYLALLLYSRQTEPSSRWHWGAQWTRNYKGKQTYWNVKSEGSFPQWKIFWLNVECLQPHSTRNF